MRRRNKKHTERKREGERRRETKRRRKRSNIHDPAMKASD